MCCLGSDRRGQQVLYVGIDCAAAAVGLVFQQARMDWPAASADCNAAIEEGDVREEGGRRRIKGW
jgi:hypothetical protein